MSTRLEHTRAWIIIAVAECLMVALQFLAAHKFYRQSEISLASGFDKLIPCKLN